MMKRTAHYALHTFLFFFSSRRRHTRWPRDWSSDVCSSDLEHKLWARNVQASTLDELPAYGLLDLDIPAPVLPEGVHYPVWIKPVNGASSEGAFQVHDDGELRARLPEVRAVIDRLGRPFQEVMNMVEAPPEIARVGGMGCLVEEPATGHQMTVEERRVG